MTKAGEMIVTNTKKRIPRTNETTTTSDTSIGAKDSKPPTTCKQLGERLGM